MYKKVFIFSFLVFFVSAIAASASGPTLLSCPPPEGMVGTPYRVILAASGGTPPYVWSVTGGALPNGLSLDSTTGIISGTPTINGISSFQITISDSTHQTLAASLSITVGPAQVGAVPLYVSPCFLPQATAGSAYSATFVVMGGTPPYTFAVQDGLPSDNFSFYLANGIVAGTPMEVGTVSFGIVVTDSGEPQQQSNLMPSITIGPNPGGVTAPLAITPTPPPTAAVGVPYSSTFQATGGMPFYSWSVATGSLPAGLSLNSSTGAISGSPTTNQNAYFTLSVDDLSGSVATRGEFVYVAPPPNQNPPQFGVITKSLPQATVGVPYSATLAGANGVPPDSWSVVGLPSGLSLDPATGIISGTPAISGAASLAVTLHDSKSATLPVQVSISVVPSALMAPPPVANVVSNVPGALFPFCNQVTGTLDGSGSRDPNDTPLTYLWTDGSGNMIGTTAIVNVSAVPFLTAFTLTVTDAAGLSSFDTIQVLVQPFDIGPGCASPSMTPQPIVNSGGVVNGASFAVGPVAPGSLVSIFGTNLATSSASNSAVPLADSLGTTSVTFNGIPSPLVALNPYQINAQVPWELQGSSSMATQISVSGILSNSVPINLANVVPGIFVLSSNGSGQGAVLIANTAAVAAPAGFMPGSSPVNRGDYISIFCTGLGPVTNQPDSGAPASADPLSMTTAPASVMIGSVPATVIFAGLAPAYVGLYQVNVQVPQNAPTGDAVSLVLSIGGASSNTVTIAVQ